MEEQPGRQKLDQRETARGGRLLEGGKVYVAPN